MEYLGALAGIPQFLVGKHCRCAVPLAVDVHQLETAYLICVVLYLQAKPGRHEHVNAVGIPAYFIRLRIEGGISALFPAVLGVNELHLIAAVQRRKAEAMSRGLFVLRVDLAELAAVDKNCQRGSCGFAGGLCLRLAYPAPVFDILVCLPAMHGS